MKDIDPEKEKMVFESETIQPKRGHYSKIIYDLLMETCGESLQIAPVVSCHNIVRLFLKGTEIFFAFKSPKKSPKVLKLEVFFKIPPGFRWMMMFSSTSIRGVNFQGVKIAVVVFFRGVDFDNTHTHNSTTSSSRKLIG